MVNQVISCWIREFGSIRVGHLGMGRGCPEVCYLSGVLGVLLE